MDNLEYLLDLLPPKNGDIYFELRKQEEWVCACVNALTNGEIRNTIGNTPSEAVRKMLIAIELLG
jgi:hypothetical protein